MAFSWFTRPKKEKTLGVNLGSGNGIKAEIDKMQGSIVKASRGYQTNIKKYKEIAQFNQHLTRSYVANLKVIVDVSELLNSYTSVFNSLKDEFSKMEESMGKELDKSDFEYLESLTKSKAEELNVQFNTQADKIKRLYAQYGKPEELNRILLAQNDMQKTIEQANQTYASVSAVSETTKGNASNSSNASNISNASISSNVSNVSKPPITKAPKAQKASKPSIASNVNNSAIAANALNNNVNVSSTESIIASEQAMINASLKKTNGLVDTEELLESQAGGKKNKSKKRTPKQVSSKTNKSTKSGKPRK
jgi:hypothetical protein